MPRGSRWALSSLLLLTMLSPGAPQLTWTAASPGPGWTPRFAHCMVALDRGRVAILGGRGAGSVMLNDVRVSVDAGGAWVSQPAPPWSGRHSHTCVHVGNGSVVVVGGEGSAGVLGDVWRSSADLASWEQDSSEPLPQRRYASAGAAPSDGGALLMGGASSLPPYVLNDVWRWREGQGWELRTANASWTARHNHAAVVSGADHVLVLGGTPGTRPLGDIWRSADAGLSWQQVAVAAAWPARWGHQAVRTTREVLLVVGGYGLAGYLDDAWMSVDGGVTWEALQPAASWPPRDSLGAAALASGAIIVAGGAGADDDLYSDSWVLGCEAGDWDADTITCTGLPSNSTCEETSTSHSGRRQSRSLPHRFWILRCADSCPQGTGARTSGRGVGPAACLAIAVVVRPQLW